MKNVLQDNCMIYAQFKRITNFNNSFHPVRGEPVEPYERETLRQAQGERGGPWAQRLPVSKSNGERKKYKSFRIFHAIALLVLLHGFICGASIEDLITQGKQLLSQAKIDDALLVFNTAQQQDPNNCVILSQIALAHSYKNNYDTAQKLYRKCTELQPSQLNYRYNIATLANKMGNFEEATHIFETLYKEIQLDPIKINLVKNYLRTEQWNNFRKLFPTNLWWYDRNIYGQTVLLELDKEGNGFGDAIQFVRYARRLHQAGAHVIVQVQKSLVDLFRLLPYVDDVITTKDSVPFSDESYSICIASLMYCMRSYAQSPINDTPYLYADSHLIEEWKTKVDSSSFKVGLCWQSSPVRDNLRRSLPNPRAVPITNLEPLLANKSVQFYSLHRKEDLYTSAPSTITVFDGDFDQSHGRFMDTAALIMNLDLIITVDTSIAHLAGALGKPVWLLLCAESDYRWFINRSDSPWYPTMRLFRQKKYYQWDNVVLEVCNELKKIKGNL